MFNLSVRTNSSPWPTLSLSRIKLSANSPLLKLTLAMGLLAGNLYAPHAHSQEVPVQAQAQVAPQVVAQGTARALEDGVYLYGQSSKPNQIGKTYAVMEVKQGKVIGAFYMPSSSFDCFHGQLEAEKLALTVVDSYERTSYPYAIALERNYPVASTGLPPINGLKLQGFHGLATISDTDQRILNTCKADYQQTAKQ